MNRRHIVAIFKKQLYDNKKVLIQFLIYPIMVLIFIFAPVGSDSYKMTIVTLMSSVLTGMAPLITISDIVQEDKRTGTLRMLILSNVKPLTYLIGVTIYIICNSLLTAIMIGAMAGFGTTDFFCYILCMLMGSLCTLVFGSAMSCLIDHSFSSIFIVILSMLNGFVPILTKFYPSASILSKYWYTQVVTDIVGDIYDGFYGKIYFRFTMLVITLLLFLVLFFVSFNKNKLIDRK